MNFRLTNLANVTGGLDLILEFPHFYKTVSYDPDFSVALNVDGNNGGNYNNDLLPLLSLLVLLMAALFEYAELAAKKSPSFHWIVCNEPQLDRLKANIHYLLSRGGDSNHKHFGNPYWITRLSPKNVEGIKLAAELGKSTHHFDISVHIYVG